MSLVTSQSRVFWLKVTTLKSCKDTYCIKIYSISANRNGRKKSSPDLQTQSHLKDDSPETENLMCNKDKSEETPSIHGSVGCYVEITTMPTTDDENPLPPSTPSSSDKHLFSSTPSSSGTQYSNSSEDLYDPSPNDAEDYDGDNEDDDEPLIQTDTAIPSATEEILPQEKGSKIENMI
ncbi:hypothetical protein CEXT_706271 [Caerostris extrusa]|uniref:Uncharacterized protein n=1 Tax=Caerostris extrusa TaxID=172846 RepID=A0AAV4T676_CAEEX|nr:hypothetical protein CEXT_706271 [Caerostris extrusa]